MVDGGRAPGTVLMLSHWPKSGTPAHLKDDLSAQIAFRWLDQQAAEPADLVSNDHFDEDGLVSVFALEQPEAALRQRELLIDVAAAGDFAVYRDRRAAQIAFTIACWNDPDRSPLGAQPFALPYPQRAAAMYLELLPRLPELMAAPERYREHWADEAAHLDESEDAIRSGALVIEERPELDLAIVRTAGAAARRTVHRFTQQRQARWHPMAIHNATNCLRTLLIDGASYELHYRYESWVQYMTRRPAPRVDLTPLAAELTAREPTGKWQFDGVKELAPRLWREGDSALAPEDVIERVTGFLARGAPAWDPYD